MSVASWVMDDLRVNTVEILGTGTAATQAPGDNSTKLATTAFVQAAAGTGTVTHTGVLTAHAVVVGNGGADEKTISADTTTTHALFATATDPAFRAIVGSDLPNPSATTLGGIESLASVASKWINTISTSGVPSATQPAFSDISGTAGLAQGGTNADLSAAGSATAFLAESASHVISARSIVGADLPNPSATTLGGIESLAAVSHKWINTISTSGVPSATQPAAADLSDGTTGSGTVVLSVSPALTGAPTAPTQSAGDNTTDIATDAFVVRAALAAFMLPVFVL